MIELVIKKFLDGQLDVPSFFEHKPNMPESYVILEKTGSGGSDFLIPLHSLFKVMHHHFKRLLS
ncbi:gp45 [Streptococcus pneumoniae]|nr:gp45 [Streptococcus pneumoniae]